MSAALAQRNLSLLAPPLPTVISVGGLIFGEDAAHWSDVWTGAVFTAILFPMGTSVIGLYISRFGVSSGLGAAGSLLIVLR